MLNVIKFFKRSEDSEKLSLQEFEALKDGLELYGINQLQQHFGPITPISEMKKEMLEGK